MRLRKHDTLHSELIAVACWRRGTCNEKKYNMRSIEGTGVRYVGTLGSQFAIIIISSSSSIVYIYLFLLYLATLL